MIDVTLENFPRVYELLVELAGANGEINREEPQPDVYRVPRRFAEVLPHINAAVGHLTGEEIATLTDGEQGDARAIALRNPSLTAAHQLLEAVFNGEDDEVVHAIGRTTLSGGSGGPASETALGGGAP